ncbi:putative RNA-directed DNA polymerase [Tanacetum coccineum]
MKFSNETSNDFDKNNKHVNGLCDSKENSLNLFDVQSPKRPNDEEGDSSNVKGNTWVTFDDYDNTVEDEVINVATQIGENVTFEGNFNDYVVSSNVKYGLEKYVCYANLSCRNMCFSTTLNKSTDPKTLHETSQNPKWIVAMNLEMKVLHRNDTYVLSDLPLGRKSIGCKWIWKIKYKSSGEIEWYKVRLVAKGFSQREGIDYEEDFSLVVKMVTIRCLIAKYVQNNLPLYQLDVNSAFLYGDLNEVYMELPPGYYNKNETKVCMLVKSLYGLKQAPREWNEKLTTALIENDFVQSKNDYSSYVKSNDGIFIAILVYVDDIVITGNNGLGIDKFKRKYCLELLSEYGLLACKPVTAPLQQNIVLNHEESENDKFLPNMTEYQIIIGELIYLPITRHDISYVVHCLSQHMHAPLQSQVTVALRVLRFLKNAPGTGVQFHKGKSFSLHVYSDADWTKCLCKIRSLYNLVASTE